LRNVFGIMLADRVKEIARIHFKNNFVPFTINSTILENQTWLVKGFVTLFGKESGRTLRIDSKTGNIIKVESY